VSRETLGDTLVEWAQSEGSVRALLLIGSRARQKGAAGAADAGSDWDFQVITDKPQLFYSREWTARAGLSKPLVYVTRPGRLGRIVKMSGIFPEGELDLALIPTNHVRLAKWLLYFGVLPYFPRVHRAISELTMVLLSGYRFTKGTEGWKRFFQQITSQVSPWRLNDEEICAVAEGYVCDYVSTRRKIARGELLAAQRWLHVQLAEANYTLSHELKLRRNEISFPDARRIEHLGPRTSYQHLVVSAVPEKLSLLDAVEQSAETCRNLVMLLVGEKWRWPVLTITLPLR
jgi:hypothetical protein